MKPLLMIWVVLFISIMTVGIDCGLRENTTIVPAQVTDKLIVSKDNFEFGKPTPDAMYLKIEADSGGRRYIWLEHVDKRDFDAINEGDWVPVYQQKGPLLGVLYKTIVILENE